MKKLSSQPFHAVILQKLMNTWRRDTLHLPPRSLFSDDLHVNGRDIPVLYGCSPSILPFDPKWKDRVCMEGFWFLEDTDWDPPRELESLSRQDPRQSLSVIAKMPLKHPDHVLEMTTQALRQTGQRGIILVGWSGMQISEWGREHPVYTGSTACMAVSASRRRYSSWWSRDDSGRFESR